MQLVTQIVFDDENKLSGVKNEKALEGLEADARARERGVLECLSESWRVLALSLQVASGPPQRHSV